VKLPVTPLLSLVSEVGSSLEELVLSLLLFFQIVIPFLPVLRHMRYPLLFLMLLFRKLRKIGIDAPVLSAAVVDALDFYLSIPVQLSCSSYGSYIEKECES